MPNGLLVASPQMVDPHFAGTVVLLCEYDEQGALGIVINRDSGINSDEVFDQMKVDQRDGVQALVLWGGPVQPGSVFLTFAGGQLPALEGDDASTHPMFTLADDLRVTPDRALVEAVAARLPDQPAVLSVGYAGWGPGQLDSEIESGSWILIELDREVLFDLDVADRYEHCIQSLGVQPEMLWMTPIDE